MQITEEIYKKYEPMINKFARKNYKKMGCDLEDAVSILTLHVCSSMKYYSKERGSLCTFIFIVLLSSSLTEIKKAQAKKNRDILFTDEILSFDFQIKESPEDRILLFEGLAHHPNKIVRAITKILSTYRIPVGKYAPTTINWIKGVLKTKGHTTKDIKEGISIFKTLY